MSKYSKRSLYRFLGGAIVFLSIAGCKGHTHITGTVKNRWGGSAYPATITLREGEHYQQVQVSRDGKFDVALEHSPFRVKLTLTAIGDFYKPVEKSFSSSDRLRNIDLTMEEAPEPTAADLRKSLLKSINLKDGRELAEQMCRQLPNAAAFPLKSFTSGDDVHDTLVLLSGVAQSCLVDHMTDSSFMPDSRSEPLADFRAGDAALWILGDAGLDFEGAVVPLLNQKRWHKSGVYAYFYWVNQGNHRKLVQTSVKRWLQQHPQCCGSEADFNNVADAGSPAKISGQRMSDLQKHLAAIRPGMDEQPVRDLLGPPDAEADVSAMGGVISLNRFEKSALFYFAESGGKKLDFHRRNFLRDRYVIVFVSENGKFVRAFSNIPEIPPIYPHSGVQWQHMIRASMAARR